jgi:hypothetical protein
MLSTAAPPFVTTFTNCSFDYVFLIAFSSVFFTSSLTTGLFLFPTSFDDGEGSFLVYFLPLAEDFEAFKSTTGLISFEADLTIVAGFEFLEDGEDLAGVFGNDFGSLFLYYFLAWTFTAFKFFFGGIKI